METTAYLTTYQEQQSFPPFICNYEDLVNRYEAKVFRYAVLLAGDMAIAENVLCESFIEAFEAVHTGRILDEESFKCNLYRTTRTLVALVEAKETQRHTIRTAFQYLKTVVDLDDYKLSRGGVLRVLDQLSEIERSVFLLKDVDGLTRQEISAIIDLPVETIKSHLHKARLFIRKSHGAARKRCLFREYKATYTRNSDKAVNG